MVYINLELNFGVDIIEVYIQIQNRQIMSIPTK